MPPSEQEDMQEAVCENCGCGFRFFCNQAAQLNGRAARCHCGNNFVLMFFDKVVQFEAVAPHPCKAWAHLDWIEGVNMNYRDQ
jgi:hypothetical protein